MSTALPAFHVFNRPRQAAKVLRLAGLRYLQWSHMLSGVLSQSAEAAGEQQPDEGVPGQ